ncbi:MAG: ParB/RepB/Spo0J family partition protein [Okeania sp. SIO2H7]|nr:ParB/RepB/Spo0J family partition protein [Okeania sp. SIO2H7]
MQSIHDIGIIHPLIIDQNGVLLAGGHRLLALQMLQNHHKARFFEWFPGGKVPVRKMPFTVESNPDWALDIEISENNVREDYTPDEVWAIAERLREAGYEDTPGKPKAGEKRLRPALMTITGKSERSIRRYLNNREKRTNETRPSDRVSESDKQLQKAIALLQKWETSHGQKRRETTLAKNLPNILKQLQEGLK